ncbi:MAG: LysM peptidoglycan-binding domain-containing protein [Chloroflexi bacterium]|nr:LysM peptidoglycan-binding domain-containing protein [Chloroflexota bacterium]
MRSLVLAVSVGLIALFALASASFAADQSTSYIVEPGDNLWKIARKFDTSPSAIIELNGLKNPNLLYVGEKLLIPVNSNLPSPAPDPGGSNTPPEEENWLPEPFAVTRYCLQGNMSSGKWVHDGAVAADASIFPLGTRLEIEGLGTYTVEDRFAWDAGVQRLDVWTASCSAALQWGVRYRNVRLLSKAGEAHENPAVPGHAEAEVRALQYISQWRPDIVSFFVANGWSSANTQSIIREWLKMTNEAVVSQAGRDALAVARNLGFSDADGYALDYIGTKRPDVISFYSLNGWASQSHRSMVKDWLKITDEGAVSKAERDPLKVAVSLGWSG